MYTGILIKILSRRWLLHLLFWTLIFLDAYLGNLPFMEPRRLYWHVGLGLGFNITLGYINLLVLYPLFFEKGRLGLYAISVLGLILTASLLAQHLWSHKQIFTPDYPYRYFLFRAIWWQGLVTGAKFFREGIFNYLKLQELKETQRKAELDLLKSQLNPHFIFNTLNNLYSLTLHQAPDAPEAVMRLSELLRYMHNVTGWQQTSLEKEILYIENYIELEKLRLNEGAKVVLNKEGDFTEMSIAPLILLPFVENAFKHGVETQTNNIRVNINVVLRNKTVHFYCENTKFNSKPAAASQQGTGLANVKKRLALIYPNRHKLTIKDEAQWYKIELQIGL